jgi:hypothetical protein
MDPGPASSLSEMDQESLPAQQEHPVVKRPISIYFIAAWCFLGLFSFTVVLTRVLKRDFPEVETTTKIWSSLGGLLFILVIWHTVRLVQLRPFNRWFAFVFFIFWMLTSVVSMFLFGLTGQNPFSSIAGCSVNGLFSLTSALYLAHPRFRKLAVQFVAERDYPKHLRMMQKASQKLILKELKK